MNKGKAAATPCAGDNMRKQDTSEISEYMIAKAIWKRVLQFKKKRTHEVFHETTTIFLSNKYLYSCKNLYTDDYSSIICNNTKLDITQMPFSGQMILKKLSKIIFSKTRSY